MSDEIRAAGRDLSALRIERGEARGGGKAVWIVLLLVLAAGAAGWGIWSSRAGAATVEVKTGLVRRLGASESSAMLSAGGYVLPDRKADVSARSFGRLEWVGIEVGSRVKRDEIIARLANADLAAAVEEAKASLADAERELARQKELLKTDDTPKVTVDKAETAVLVARAQVKQAEAAYEYTLIRAPFDGVVVRRLAQVGETVGPSVGAGSGSSGTALCTIVDRTSLEMVADVNEANIAKIRLGQPVEVSVDALPDRKYKGEVRQIVPTADRAKGIVQVKVKLIDLDDAVLPEMAARASFLHNGAEAGGRKRVVAPEGAVRERGGRRIVFVVEGETARRVEVEIGAELTDGVEILRGLTGGERVVTGGGPVEDGARVRIASKE